MRVLQHYCGFPLSAMAFRIDRACATCCKFTTYTSKVLPCAAATSRDLALAAQRVIITIRHTSGCGHDLAYLFELSARYA
jgi:hypothetical protein